jgi:Flp pilus assembly protein TadD
MDATFLSVLRCLRLRKGQPFGKLTQNGCEMSPPKTNSPSSAGSQEGKSRSLSSIDTTATSVATGDNSGHAFGKDLSPSGFRKGMALLFLLGLLVRIGFLLEHAYTPSFGVPTLDQKYYDTVARMLLAGNDLHQLHGFRPLLYPMFLASCYQLGGSWGVDLAVVVQHLLGVGTGLIVALLGARLFQHRLSGLVGGILFLLAPVPLYFEGELLIESSYTFLICLGLLLIACSAQAQGWKSGLLWLLCGALTILTSQARANILVFMAVYPLFTAWRWWRFRTTTAFIPLLGLAGGLAMAIPWGIINMRQSDHFHLSPNAGGVNLYLGNKRTANGMVPEQERRIASPGRYEDSVEVWARQEYENSMRAQGRQPDTDPMAISSYWTGRTLDEIRAAPASWLRLLAKKSWLTLWNAEVPNNKAFAFLQQEFVWLQILPVRWVVLLMLAPAGIWAAARWGQRDTLFILLVYAGIYSAGNVAFFICDRYRYPVWPVVAVIAGGGLLACLEMVRRCRLRQTLWLAAIMVLLAALSLHNWFGAKLPSFARDYLFRSIAWYEKGHFEEALNDIDRSVALDPSDTAAVHHRGNVLLALNRFNEASVAYQQALKLTPEEATAWNDLGVALDELGRTDEALVAFRRATQCQPPSKNAFLGLAFIQLRSGRLDDAATSLDRIKRLDGSPDAATLAACAVLERRRGHNQAADGFDEQARRLDPAAAAWAIQRAAAGGKP